MAPQAPKRKSTRETRLPARFLDAPETNAPVPPPPPPPKRARKAKPLLQQDVMMARVSADYEKRKIGEHLYEAAALAKQLASAELPTIDYTTRCKHHIDDGRTYAHIEHEKLPYLERREIVRRQGDDWVRHQVNTDRLAMLVPCSTIDGNSWRIESGPDRCECCSTLVTRLRMFEIGRDVKQISERLMVTVRNLWGIDKWKMLEKSEENSTWKWIGEKREEVAVMLNKKAREAVVSDFQSAIAQRCALEDERRVAIRQAELQGQAGHTL